MELAANLDSMTPAQLREYAQVMDSLSEYARLKADAIERRQNGRIGTAIMQERLCNNIYLNLPQWAKSW
jgi:hypothetical protein